MRPNRLQRVVAVLILALALPALCGCGGDSIAGPAADSEQVTDYQDKLGIGPSAVIPPPPPKPKAMGVATIRGVFRLRAGEAIPQQPNVFSLIQKDQSVCAPGGGPVYHKSIVVDPQSRGIANVVIYLRNLDDYEWAEGVEPPPEAVPLPDDLDRTNPENVVEYDQEKCIFLSHVDAFRVGKWMRILNSDTVGHNTNCGAIGLNQSISPKEGDKKGELYFKLPKKPTNGPKEVTCSIHPWMQAWLMTSNDGYFAVTKADGSFELKNLPAGKGIRLSVQVWHESAANLNQVLEVDGPTSHPKLDWKKQYKGQFFIELEPGEDVPPLEVDVPADAFNIRQRAG